MTLLTENQLDKYMEKFSYQLHKEFENENMNKSYNYFIFLSRHKNELMQNHISLEAILYTAYSVFTKFLQDYEKNIQKDAGLEQQHYNLIQDIEREIGTVDWDLLQKIERNAWTGYGAAAEALGFVLLAVGAAFAGRDLLAGIIELIQFFTTVDDAKSEEDLKACGKLFGDAVAKIGVDGLFFALSMFGLKKASARLTTRTVVNNGLNSRKWKGKIIKERRLKLDDKGKRLVIKKTKVLEQIYYNENGAYGYLPKDGAAYDSPKYDFTNVEWAKEQRLIRSEYLKASDELELVINKMTNEGKSKQEIAKYVVKVRNQQKVNFRARMKPDEVIELESRNMKKYGNPVGPDEKWLFEYNMKKTAMEGKVVAPDVIWDMVIEESIRKDDVINTLLGLIY